MDKPKKLIAYDTAVIDKILSNLDRVTTTGVGSNAKLLEAYNLISNTGVAIPIPEEGNNGNNSSDS